MKKFLLMISSVALCTLAVNAKVKLSGAIGDNMVLQRQSQASIWGWADAGKSVSVHTSWNSKSYSAKADKDGKWLVKVATPDAGGPYTIKISDGQPVTLSNVMIGEVWVCSGQSNMEMRMAGNSGQPIDGALDAILTAGKYRDRVRVITVPRNSTKELQEDILPNAKWEVSEPATAGQFSAVAYYFARNVADALDIPVGVIATSWGGSAIETWMDEATVLGVQGIDQKRVKGYSGNNNAIGLLYNGMIWPVKDYTARGFLWYQGESNRHAYKEYAGEQAAMVAKWRNIWGKQDMPFYFVQIAPYWYNDSSDQTLGFLTEAQFKSLAMIPNSGMAPTTDIGDEYCIHPPQKDVVGKRLALLALTKTYGMTGFPSHGPVYKSVEFANGKAVVTFDYSKSLSPENQDVLGFEIAGSNRVFVPATARVVKGKAQVELSSPLVPKPAAVRYAWRNYMDANLKDTYGIAAYPFRTDDWEK